MTYEIQHIGSVSILIYEDAKWNEIPTKDNPAFRKTIHADERDWPEWKSVLVCKVLPYENCVGKDGYCVLDISKNVPDVVRLGLFWNLDNAKMFAMEYAKAKNKNPMLSAE